MIEKKEEKPAFNPFDWEKVISTEPEEKAQCDQCKRIIESKQVGKHMYCEYCQKYIWRKKPGK